MSIKPILFNTEMVRAILDGLKGVTRRLGNWKIAKLNIDRNGTVTATVFKETNRGKKVSHFAGGTMDEFIKTFSDYQQGDILYVRETWHKDINRFMYRADYGKNEKFYRNGKEVQIKWQPSIHMPKEAARIWLKVKDVRVERLQDMDCKDAMKEGIDPRLCINLNHTVVKFQKLWNSTIKKSDLDRYGWDANPWVWVIEFERIELE